MPDGSNTDTQGLSKTTDRELLIGIHTTVINLDARIGVVEDALAPSRLKNPDAKGIIDRLEDVEALGSGINDRMQKHDEAIAIAAAHAEISQPAPIPYAKEGGAIGVAVAAVVAWWKLRNGGG